MDAKDKYIREHSSPQGEALDWVERQTNIRTNHARMLTGAAQGRFIKMLVGISGAENILEIGAFTGYSAICLASGLPENGHLDSLEINDELEDLILEGFAKETIGRLRTEILDRRTKPMYDMVYIDANKREYCEYYESVFDMVRPGGLILADNVLWDGKVWADPLPQDRQTLGIARFNDMVAADERVESVILPVRDGLNIIRKKDLSAI